MHYTIQKLIEGDERIISYYQKAKELWDEILSEINIKDNSNISILAKTLSDKQILDFEIDCGGRYLGQEIMAWYGIAQFYRVEDGFGGDLERLQSAKNVYEAFKKSYCSLEVKSAARDAAENYNLDEY